MAMISNQIVTFHLGAGERVIGTHVTNNEDKLITPCKNEITLLFEFVFRALKLGWLCACSTFGQLIRHSI